jgi:hypothetical protein
MNNTNIHDGKIQVKVPITLADLKLLKNMTTLTGSTQQLSRLYFVVKENQWYAWTSDSYILGITQWCRNDSIMAKYNEDDPQHFNMYADTLYASVDVKQIVKYIAEINKHLNAAVLDGYMDLHFEGYAKLIQPKVMQGKEITCDYVSIAIEDFATYQMLNRADKVEQSRDVFRNFWSDARDSLHPDKRRPITHLQYSPVHLKRVMTYLTFNKDEHFTYMYNYDGNFADAVLFEKTCSGTDNATSKYAWIMPQRSELEEE